jgi:hypothetical protein
VGVTGGEVLAAVVGEFAVGDSAAVATGVEVVADVAVVVEVVVAADAAVVADGAAVLVDVSAVWVEVELLPMQADAMMRTERPIMSAGSGGRWKSECGRRGSVGSCICHRFRGL